MSHIHPNFSNYFKKDVELLRSIHLLIAFYVQMTYGNGCNLQVQTTTLTSNGTQLTNKVKNFFHIILRFYITFNYLGTYRQMHTSLKSPVSLSLVTKFIIAVKNLLNEEITAPQFNVTAILHMQLKPTQLTH